MGSIECSVIAPPPDYLERVYAGVLGKLIGVYLGRPIEGRTHQMIMETHGHVRYYLTDSIPGYTLVNADDDISGTFAFIRALEEHGVTPNISAAQIGRTWLNNSIDSRCPFWWGGRGISTEHTAYVNLASGIEAPRSGAIETNGKTVAEQIGGQIFIDGWALVAPGNPDLAAKLADEAASVSHDGEARWAARSWAAMEAEAFLSKNVDHLLDTGARYIPRDSTLAKVIADVRAWTKAEPDWLKVRQMIEDTYGYDKFGGACHVIPNHAIMILGLIHGGNNFHEAMHIINTCGWDTDCNSGNLGCLVAIMHGVEAIDQGGPDWRGPIADRATVSTADGGYTVNNATRIAYDIANSGLRLAGCSPLSQPKDAQYHFSLPGSVQGFQVFGPASDDEKIAIRQEVRPDHGPGLAIRIQNLTAADGPREISTATFVDPETRQGIRTYDFVGSPLLYPGQKVTALIRADSANPAEVTVALRLQVYSPNPHPEEVAMYAPNPSLDILTPSDGPSASLPPGQHTVLEWTIPDNMDSQPIARVGLAIHPCPSSSPDPFTGKLYLDLLRWSGTPRTRFRKPSRATINASQAWREAWVNAASTFHWYASPTFGISQTRGEGKIVCGTREWTDYRVTASDFRISVAAAAGLMVRNQGVNRFYAFVFSPGGKVGFVKALDGVREELGSVRLEWELERKYEVCVTVRGAEMWGEIDGEEMLRVSDERFASGGIGLVVVDGAAGAEEFTITPVEG